MAALRFFFTLLMIPVTIFFAAAAVVGMLATYIDPAEWWLPAFAGLSLPLFLTGNLIFVIFWGIKKTWFTLLPLAAIVINYTFLTTIFQVSPKETDQHTGGMQIKIASYNVQNFIDPERSSSMRNVARSLLNDSTTIICFQEYRENSKTNSDTIARIFPAYPHRSIAFNHKTSYANYGLAIYSQYPIVRTGYADFNSITNSAMWADLLIGQDTVRVFNIHLQTTSVSTGKEIFYQKRAAGDFEGQARAIAGILGDLRENFTIRSQQVTQLREIMDTTRYPLIVCGDFNDTPASYTYHQLKDGLLDGFNKYRGGFGYTFRGIKKILRIDYIFYSPSFRGLFYLSPPYEWSDHNPVIMQLSLEKS